MSSQEEDPYESNELRNLSKIMDLKYPQSFVDCYGSLLVLPVDSHTSLARYIASYNIKKLKRYCVNQVYRSDSSCSPPESSSELSFDIVSPERKASHDAQVIQLGLFDQVNLVEFESEDYPDERLIACRNPFIAQKNQLQREALLEAVEKELL